MKEQILKLIEKLITENENKTEYEIMLMSKYAIRDTLTELKEKVSQLEPLIMPFVDLEKLRLKYEKKFTYGGITGIAAFQNVNPIEVWEFFITELPKIIKSA